MQIQEIFISDKDALVELNNSIFTILYDESFYNHIFSSKGIHVFLFIEERVLGTVSFHIDKRSAYVFTFGILPELRQRGIGKRCWTFLEEFLKAKHGCNYISLHSHTSNLIAKEFYIKNGFSLNSVIQDYYEDIFPTSAYHLEKFI